MENVLKPKERRFLRERKQLKEAIEENSTKVGSESLPTLQINLNLAGSEQEFKKFEKLLGDSLERVQSLRKGRTAREASQERKDKGEYYFAQAKSKKQPKPPEVKNPKSSLLSSAETQLTQSGLYDEPKPRDPSQPSFTIQYLLNENKHLKQQIEMILKSRSKLNQTEHLVKTLSQYRKIISEQYAEISLLKKYHILLIKEGEKTKLELAAKDTKIDVLKMELEKIRSNVGDSKKIREITDTPLKMEEISNALEKVRQYFRRSQNVQDLVNCLEKEIFWSSKQQGITAPSPRHIK